MSKMVFSLEQMSVQVLFLNLLFVIIIKITVPTTEIKKDTKYLGQT